MSDPMPPITNPAPISIAAREAMSFNEAFLLHLGVDTINADTLRQVLVIELWPYNHEAAKLAPAVDDAGKPVCSHRMAIDDLAAEAARVPELARVMASVVTVADLLVKERTCAVQLAAAQDDATRATLQQQLSAVQTALGIAPPTPAADAGTSGQSDSP